MASEAMALCNKGGRYQTRGWTGARWVKRNTSKRSRRLARAAIRDNNGESTVAVRHGWVW